MNLLDRHVRIAVLLSIAIVLGIIVSLDLIFSLIDELGESGVDYTVGNALLYVALTTPTSIYELLPFAALGGTIFGLGVLASNNELVVMQTAGVHKWRIVLAVLKPALLVMVLGLLLGEYASPALEQVANSNKAIQLSGSSSINSETGTWHKIGNDFIHINAIAPGGVQLYGVSRYTANDDRQLISASFTESAQYIEDGDGAYWRMNNVRQSRFFGSRISTTSYSQENWTADLSPQLLSLLLVEPGNQSISGLYRFARFFQTEGLDSSIYFLAFWKKLLQPLSTLVLVVLAISFVFGPLREATMGYRIFIALGIGLAFTTIQRMMEPVSLIYGLSPLMAVLTPILLSACLGLLLMRRVS
ncbi:MAG: LPS export ABC transporter permease LptG [Gammaproteobacteria bacterium]|jgi:lipopolysaccharide export system permease protein|nr:LPS export ABC transporter permease LptG [Gammaproteobacteria bacterium]MDP6536289.1 LPS export ABC transporter permease LptG [Gammaproteobacteria bacterium]MDP6732330.1 LPS export ABC transporter permease LptG [Gammaproteobacteria bacterium]HAJ74851.1 LPS export ABC transporter permease LptG [Gammaproteobacteria bacterium]